MIPAVSSTSAATTSTAAARQTSEEAFVRSLELDSVVVPVSAERESAVVNISQEAALQAAIPAGAEAQSQKNNKIEPANTAPAATATTATTATTNPEDATPAETLVVQGQQIPAKPDWVYLTADGNKDGKVTVFEQQAYDFRHYPSSLEKAEAYNKAFSEPKPDAKLTA